jgi:predicted Co/Zn/Cd cation transporter (cation efflux family)
MSMILSLCAVVACLALWFMAKRRADQAEQNFLHLTAKTEHLEQHLSQTLGLIQDIAQKMQQQQQDQAQQAARLQHLERQHAQLVELMMQLVKTQQK